MVVMIVLFMMLKAPLYFLSFISVQLAMHLFYLVLDG